MNICSSCEITEELGHNGLIHFLKEKNILYYKKCVFETMFQSHTSYNPSD